MNHTAISKFLPRNPARPAHQPYALIGLNVLVFAGMVASDV